MAIVRKPLVLNRTAMALYAKWLLTTLVLYLIRFTHVPACSYTTALSQVPGI